MVFSLVFSTQEIKGVPMLPAKIVENPAVFRMCSMSEVVVVFPLDPVMPTSRPFRKRQASSISLQIVMLFERANRRSGASAGTPGLGMIKSASRTSSSRWPPSSKATPAFCKGTTASPSSFSARVSVAVTCAPRAAQNRAVATPVLARPTTRTRLFRSSMDADIFFSLLNSLPQFQSRQCEQRKNQRGNPEAHDHLGFAPAQQFEMMMNRGHAKNAFPAQLERKNLQNDRQRLHHKDPAHKEQQNLLLDDDRNRSERSAKGQRPDVSHENLRGMRVVPEESQRSAHERAAKNGELADFGDVLNVEIRSPAKVAADVSKYGKSSRSDDGATDGEAVQTVSEIHGVRGTDNHQANKDEKRDKGQGPPIRRVHQRMNHEIRMKALCKRNHQLRRIDLARQEHQQ